MKNKTELEEQISIETQKLEQLQTAAKEAGSRAQSAIERDSRREDGSPRQDNLHQQILQNTIDSSHEASAAYEKQKKLVSDLIAQR